MRRICTLFTVLAASSLVGATALPAQTIFSDRSTWSAAVSGVTTLDFSGIAPAGFYAVIPNPDGGVTFSGANFFYATDPAYSPSFYDWGTGPVLFASSSNWTMTFGAGVRAVGLSFGSIVSDLFSFTLNGGSTFGPYTGGTKPDWAFFGLTSNSDITTLSVNSVLDPYVGVVIYDDVSYAVSSASVVPEPSTMMLLATGLVSIGGLGLRRRSKSV